MGIKREIVSSVIRLSKGGRKGRKKKKKKKKGEGRKAFWWRGKRWFPEPAVQKKGEERALIFQKIRKALFRLGVGPGER